MTDLKPEEVTVVEDGTPRQVTTIAPAAALEAQMRTVADALASQYAVTYRRAPGGSIRDLRLVATRGSKFLVTRATAKR